MRRTFSLLMGVVVTSFVLSGCGSADQDSPEAVVTALMDAMRDNDVDAARPLVVPEQRDKLAAEDGPSRLERFTVSAARVDGDRAEVPVEMTVDGDKTVTIDWAATRIDGLWYVDINQTMRNVAEQAADQLQDAMSDPDRLSEMRDGMMRDLQRQVADE